MSHSYSNNYVHVIYSTKDRRDLIPAEFEKRLYSFVAAVASGHNPASCCRRNGEPQPHSLPAARNNTVGIRNQPLQDKFLAIPERGLIFQWQNGYGAFSVSTSQLDKVTTYIRSQPEHHKKMTFEDEFLALLKKAGVSYDPTHVFG